MKILKATIKDVQKIRKMNKDLFIDNSAYDKTLNLDWPDRNLNYYKEKIEGNDSISLLAIDDKEIVGYLIGSICKNEDWRTVQKMAELDNMIVNPSFRRKGVGTNLIKEFKKWAKSKGVTRVKVSVYAKNVSAISLYEKNGFLDYSHTLEANI